MAPATVAPSVAYRSVVAVIAGGILRTVEVSQTFKLDASGSYDPDQVANSAKTYSWACNRFQTANPGQTASPWNFPQGVPSTQASATLPQNSLEAGYTYQCTVTFTVTTSSMSLVRSDSAMVTLQATTSAVPNINLVATWLGKGETSSSKVPFGQSVQIASNAQSAVAPSNPLSYSWQELNFGLALPSSTSQDLSVPAASLISGRTYSFEVTVTDVGPQVSATARIEITISSPPVVASISTSPLSGVQFTTSFATSVTATGGEGSLNYQFTAVNVETQQSNIITGLQSSNSYAATLPKGSYNMQITVRDSLGVSTTVTGTQVIVVSEPSAPADPCSTYNATLRALIGTLPQSAGPNGMCGALERGLSSLILANDPAQALFKIDLILKELATYQQNVASNTVCYQTLTFGCDGASNLKDASDTMTAIMTAAYRIIASGNNGDNRLDAQSIASLLALSAGATCLDEIDSLTQSAISLIASTAPADLAFTSVGTQMAQVISNLVMNSLNTNCSNSSLASNSDSIGIFPGSAACVAAENAAALLQRFNDRLGLALVIGSPIAAQDTTMFRSAVKAVNLDGSTQTSSNGATIVLPNSAPSALAVLSNAQWLVSASGLSMDNCRMTSDVGKVDTRTYPIALRLSGQNTTAVFAPSTMTMTFADISAGRSSGSEGSCVGAKSCLWWDSSANVWNSTGCTYVESSDSCQCSALLGSDYRISSAVTVCDASTPLALQVTYLVLAIFYAIFLGATGFRVFSGREMSSMQKREYVLLIAQCCVRFMACLFFWQNLGVAVEAFGMMLASVLYFWNLCHLMYMWASAAHTQSLSQAPMRPMLVLIYLIGGAVSLLSLILAASLAAAKDKAGVTDIVAVTVVVLLIGMTLLHFGTWRFMKKLDKNYASDNVQKALVNRQLSATLRTRNVVYACEVLFFIMCISWASMTPGGLATAMVVHLVAMLGHYIAHWKGTGSKQKKHLRKFQGMDSSDNALSPTPAGRAVEMSSNPMNMSGGQDSIMRINSKIDLEEGSVLDSNPMLARMDSSAQLVIDRKSGHRHHHHARNHTRNMSSTSVTSATGLMDAKSGSPMMSPVAARGATPARKRAPSITGSIAGLAALPEGKHGGRNDIKESGFASTDGEAAYAPSSPSDSSADSSSSDSSSDDAAGDEFQLHDDKNAATTTIMTGQVVAAATHEDVEASDSGDTSSSSSSGSGSSSSGTDSESGQDKDQAWMV